MLEGLYNVTPTAATRLNDNFQTLSTDYGDYTQIANSVYLNVTARPRSGLVLQGGFNTGQYRHRLLRGPCGDSRVDGARCAVADQSVVRHVHGMGHAGDRSRHVHDSEGRRADSGHVPQRPGRRRWPRTGRRAELGTVGLNRPFAGVAGTTVTVNLIEPGTLYGDRINQFDMRFAKILRFGRTRTNVGVDLYNVVNSAPVLSYNQTFVPGERCVAGADLGAAAAVCEVQRANRFLSQET